MKFYLASRVSQLCSVTVLIATITLLLPSLVSGQSDSCLKNNLPVTVGGARDDVANCLVHFTSKKNATHEEHSLIVGGTTRSSDFGPANSPYGFLYSVNLDGDWTWGNYFKYNSGNIREITGCQLSSDGESIVALGKSYTEVVIAVVNGTTGRITNLYSLEDKKKSEPFFETFGAIMLDSKDPRDGKSYIYTSFLSDGQQQLVRVLQAVPDKSNEFPEIKFHYTLLNGGIKDDEEDVDFVSKKRPQHMFQLLQSDDDSFFMSGTYRGVGSVMKFYKKNSALRWHAQLDKMTRVDSIAVRPGKRGLFFGCGQNNFEDRGVLVEDRDRTSEAWFFSMDTAGSANWMIKLAGAARDPSTLSDSCQGMVFDAKEQSIVTVIQTNSPQFRVDSDESQFDTMLLQIDSSGELRRLIAISLGGNGLDMFSTPQNLVMAGDYYYMTGGLFGFQSKSQLSIPNSNTGKFLDTFLFPLSFFNRVTEGCLRERKIRQSQVESYTTFSDRRGSSKLYKVSNNDREVPKSNQDNGVYRVNYSKYVNSSPLKSFINTPRPCAYQSIQLQNDPVEYYRGSKAITYNIADESSYAVIVNQMSPPGSNGGFTQVIDQKGSQTDLAKFDQIEGGKLVFQSNVVRQIGLNELTIRHCDVYERLFDLRLKIEVKTNSQPVFEDIPETQFQLKVNETLTYNLPGTYDPEGNAKSEILVQSYAGYEELFPPFLETSNENWTLNFNVDSDDYAGQEYFFKIILKEEGLDVLGNSYYCTILIDSIKAGGSDSGSGSGSGGSSGGSGTEQGSGTDTSTGGSGGGGSETEGGSESGGTGGEGSGDSGSGTGGSGSFQTGRVRRGIVRTTDQYSLKQAEERLFVEVYTTNLLGQTRLKFTNPVNMTVVERDFALLFNPVVQRSNYFYEPHNITVKEYSYTNFNTKNQTVDLAFKFDDPEVLGLNTGKSDYLMFFTNESYPWNDILTQERQLSEGEIAKPLQSKTRARVELTFDYENPLMESVIEYSYFIMIGLAVLLALQLIILMYKNVGLLTFWTLLEYAQLVAFLPLQTARCVPFVYEAFRPFLMSHLIFDWPGLRQVDGLGDNFYSLSFQAYNITKNRLLNESALVWLLLLVVIIICDIVVKLFLKQVRVETSPRLHKWASRLSGQFRYNIYIRFLMLAYFDLVFIAGVILFDSSEEVLSMKSILSLLVLSFTVFLPWLVLFYLFAKFDNLQTREGKQKLNSLLLKVDKGSRWRIFLPCFYFFRRFVTALILVMGATGATPAYLQFAIIVLLSAIQLFYLAKEEPYVLRRVNTYVFAMELIYFVLAICIFTFTDATGNVDIKIVFAHVCLVLLCLFMFSNFMMSVYFTYQGRDFLKEKDKARKQFRKDEIIRRSDENQHRKDKRQRKKQQELVRKEEERLEQLKLKREELRQTGMSEEDILAKLPEEPVPTTGFKFGGVMGKRLIDYGIMSSTSGSEEIEFMTMSSGQRKSAGEIKARNKIDDLRRQSRPLQTHEDYYEQPSGFDSSPTPMNTTPDLHNLTADFSSNKSGKWDQFSSPAKRPGEDGPLHNRRLTTEVDSEALETDRPLMKTGYRPGQNLFTDMGDVDEDDDFDLVPGRGGGSSSRRKQAAQINNDYIGDVSWATHKNNSAQSSHQNILETSARQQDEIVMRFAAYQ